MEQDRSRMLPIAETFHSLQGEGRWVGTPMHFIRLAGCSVGKPEAEWGPVGIADLPILKTGIRAWRCYTYDGRPFACDTDFQLKEWINFANLLDDTWEDHICITGGEPLLHQEKLLRFSDELVERGLYLHLETSGTILIDPELAERTWVSVSPKKDALDIMMATADEIKLLVDGGFDLATVPEVVKAHPNVFVQPVNDELAINMENFKRCMGILRIRPGWKLSVQLHKSLGLR